jgi:hypothetical protein
MILGLLFFDLAEIRSATTPGNLSSNSVAPLILSGKQPSRPAGTYSPGIADLIALLDAKVDEGVILAFIQNSSTAYNPEATELIALRDHGTSTEILTALLHHGAELRLQMAQSQGGATSTPSPAYDQTLETSSPTYPYGYPESDDVASPNTYYSLSWPWLCPVPVYHRPRPSGSREGGDPVTRVGGSSPGEANGAASVAQAPGSASIPNPRHPNAVPSHDSTGHRARGARSR